MACSVSIANQVLWSKCVINVHEIETTNSYHVSGWCYNHDPVLKECNAKGVRCNYMCNKIMSVNNSTKNYSVA